MIIYILNYGLLVLAGVVTIGFVIYKLGLSRWPLILGVFAASIVASFLFGMVFQFLVYDVFGMSGFSTADFRSLIFFLVADWVTKGGAILVALLLTYRFCRATRSDTL
jgi:hypothetical protein